LKDQQVYEYIQKYRFSAKAEQTKSGIPISIKLAQGILESKSGRSELARKGGVQKDAPFILSKNTMILFSKEFLV
jgi:flagellum-specific peptidoglycan hydrolase FlgJ